ncbi:hypothetical protein TNCV_2550331 [Trichonephila clavipes]|nr:hypothetical protein TNCV_2550331 [Trichonephila clavipes]
MVVYRASTPHVLGSINGLGKVDSVLSSSLHWVDKLSINLAWVLNTEGLSSDRPPNRYICSCTSAPNGHDVLGWA